MYIVYGKKNCGYCERAVKLLQNRGLSFTYFSFDDNDDKMIELFTNYNWKTVPLIVISENSDISFIGGYDDLVKKLQVQASEKND